MNKIFKKVLCWLIILSYSSASITLSSVNYISNNKIILAVLDFNSNTGDKATDAMLSTGTSDSIISDLFSIEEIIVVERSRLKDINQEIIYGMTGVVDEKTVQKAGKQVGAQYILIGNWVKFADNYRVNVRLVEVETGFVISSYKNTGSDIFDLIDNIALNILDNLKINVPFDKKTKIERRDTYSTDAYKQYSLGLQAHDNGDFENVQKYMKKAIEIDPNFDKPKKYIYATFDRSGKQKNWGLGLDKIIGPPTSKSKAGLILKHMLFGSILFGGIRYLSEGSKDKKDDALMSGIAFGAFSGLLATFIGTKIKKVEVESPSNLDNTSTSSNVKYLSIENVINNYILVIIDNETPMIINDEFYIIKFDDPTNIYSNKSQIGIARVVRKQDFKVALQVKLINKNRNITIDDKLW